MVSLGAAISRPLQRLVETCLYHGGQGGLEDRQGRGFCRPLRARGEREAARVMVETV